MSEEDFFEEFDKLQDETPLIPNIIGGGSIVVSQSEDSIVITDGNTSGSEGGNGGDAGDGSDGSDDSENSNYLKCQPNFGYFFVWCLVQYFA